jgi:hypothetical protein
MGGSTNQQFPEFVNRNIHIFQNAFQCFRFDVLPFVHRYHYAGFVNFAEVYCVTSLLPIQMEPEFEDNANQIRGFADWQSRRQIDTSRGLI